MKSNSRKNNMINIMKRKCEANNDMKRRIIMIIKTDKSESM